MQALARNIITRIFPLLLALAPVAAFAQQPPAFPQEQLDQMLAPIALYPDALLSQILMASTYPLEVAEAARWSRERPGLAGDDAVQAAQGQNWDPSVRSLVAFPQVLARMDENPEWTRALGDAFLEQQPQLMDTVQYLRRKAQSTGTLVSDERLLVQDSGPSLMLQPADSQLVYVPYYDPFIVYGSWWWPAYHPVRWKPWPGYYARAGVRTSLCWGAPIGVSPGFFFGNFDWPHHRVRLARVNDYNSARVPRPANSIGREHEAMRTYRAPGPWEHDLAHRRGVEYRRAVLQPRFGGASVPPEWRASRPQTVAPAAQPELNRHGAPRAGERGAEMRQAQAPRAASQTPAVQIQPAAHVDARVRAQPVPHAAPSGEGPRERRSEFRGARR